jgi:regulator of protease activity HflC (stomatin/prohibitin superfamily)
MTLLWVIVAVAVILLVSGLRIAQEYRRAVIFRLGRYKGLRGPGLFWIIPVGIERAVIIDIRREQYRPSSKRLSRATA